MTGRYTIPYLRVANVFDGWIDYSDVLAMDFTPAEREQFSVVPGDILLNEGQSRELVGRCAVYEGQAGDYCFQNTLIRFRTNPGQSPWFYRHLFKEWLDRGRFADVSSQTTSVAHLGAVRFANMPSIDVPAEEQHLIAQRLNAMDSQIKTEQAMVVTLNMQKQGLMHDLLSGART